LLAIARAIFAEKGFEATTVSEIVARAGVAQGTFYLYFPSKIALIAALNQEMNEHIVAAVRQATAQVQTAAEVVATGVTAAFEQLEHYRDILHILHSQVALTQTLTQHEQHFGVYHHLIADLIRQRQSFGDIDSAIHPDIAARLIAGLIDHAADECYLYDTTTPSTIYKAEVIRFVQRALGIM
jgi:AcrR family transcriptional regulator